MSPSAQRLGTLAALLLAATLILVGCGGGEEDRLTEPTTGIPAAGGRCAPDPVEVEERADRVAAGNLSRKQATIDGYTEIRTCEMERNLIKYKEKICAAEIGEQVLEGLVDTQQAKQLAELKERAGC
jgi:hypothetical protein